ncbi:MAG: ORF6N domain-containing protein [Verrucomicrobia bacterium]|nr:ORF6N domain-containing protein [Verrucomicrobiota bacterium]
MSSQDVTQLVPIERVERLIHLARGEKVLLDADLARLYGVETRTLNQAVKRNPSRFPADFMFQLTIEEADSLLRSRSQSVTLNKRGKNIKYLPYAFTEQGVAMLSSVLRSERAVQVNVAIMRAFVSLRRMLAGNEVLARKLAELEHRLEGHDQAIKSLFNAIRELATPPAKPPREIGFHVREASVPYRVRRKRA